MADPIYISVTDVPKLLAGARIYIAPHHGGAKAIPVGLKLWLEAMGATLVSGIAAPRRKPVTHVLHQNERQGYDVYHTARRCHDRLSDAYGTALSIVDGPRLKPGKPSGERLEVVLCDTTTFFDMCRDALGDQLRKDAGDRRRNALFESLIAATEPFVGI